MAFFRKFFRGVFALASLASYLWSIPWVRKQIKRIARKPFARFVKPEAGTGKVVDATAKIVDDKK